MHFLFIILIHVAIKPLGNITSRSSLNSAEKCDTLGSLNKINSLEDKSDELRPKKLRTMQSFLKYERLETNQRSSSRKTLN